MCEAVSSFLYLYQTQGYFMYIYSEEANNLVHYTGQYIIKKDTLEHFKLFY